MNEAQLAFAATGVTRQVTMRAILCFLFIGALQLTSVSARLFYRKDYTYFPEFDAFYKVHAENGNISWNSAFLKCEDEGASLFYPESNKECETVKVYAEKLVDRNFTKIFVGFHDKFGIGEYITTDGKSTPSPIGVIEEYIPTDDKTCITMLLATGKYVKESCSCVTAAPTAFVCKKIEKRLCPTIDYGYKYNKNVKKCYKANERATTWQKAMETCYMEGGLLAVPYDGDEKNAIREMLKSEKKKYFVGIRKLFGNNYYTVKGSTFNDIKYHTNTEDRSYGEQGYEEYRHKLAEECGALHRNNDIQATDCKENLPFVCEMETNQFLKGLNEPEPTSAT